MIRPERDEFIAECDDCGTEFAGGVEDDFRAFTQALKAAGWQIKKVVYNNDVEWDSRMVLEKPVAGTEGIALPCAGAWQAELDPGRIRGWVESRDVPIRSPQSAQPPQP